MRALTGTLSTSTESMEVMTWNQALLFTNPTWASSVSTNVAISSLLGAHA